LGGERRNEETDHDRENPYKIVTNGEEVRRKK